MLQLSYNLGRVMGIVRENREAPPGIDSASPPALNDCPALAARLHARTVTNDCPAQTARHTAHPQNHTHPRHTAPAPSNISTAPAPSNINTVDLSEEKQLVESAKINAESFGRLYDHYFPKVYAFIAFKTRNSDDAEDLTGETFMKALENLHRFEWRGVPFGAWLFRIARNTLNDHYGYGAKHRTTDIDTAYGLKEDEEKTSPHKKAHLNELEEKVGKILKDLPEREMTVIRLKFFGELSNREITHVTGLSESNVAVILYRTLRRIKPDLKHFA